MKIWSPFLKSPRRTYNLIRRGSRLDHPADRRARLRAILADLDEETLEKLDRSKTVQAEKSQIKDINLTTWYHEGSDDLVNARKFIAEYRTGSYYKGAHQAP